jgi:DNA replication protein DnaD
MKQYNSKLRDWLIENKVSEKHFAEMIGLSEQGLRDIFNKKSPNTKVITALKIRIITDLCPTEYLSGLSAIKELYVRDLKSDLFK